MDRRQIETHRLHQLALQLFAGLLAQFNFLGIGADPPEDVFARTRRSGSGAR